MAITPPHSLRTPAGVDRLLAIYQPWLHDRRATTRRAAQRAVDGLLEVRRLLTETGAPS